MKCLSNLSRLQMTPMTIKNLLELYEFKGKDYYFTEILKSKLIHMKRETVEKDTFYLAEILKLEVSNHRKKLIICKNSEPKTKNEQFLANIKHVFTIINENIDNFELNTNEILALGQKLYYDIDKISYQTTLIKDDDSIFKKKISKRTDLDDIFSLYNKYIRNNTYEITQIVTNFYIDFVNLAPFTIGNSTIGVILIAILLLKEQFRLFKYVSFFEYLYNCYEEFTLAVEEANFKYNVGYSNTDPLNNLLINILLDGYRALDKMVKNKKIDDLVYKSSAIENSIFKLPQIFTKEDIRKVNPHVSLSTIDRTLAKLRDSGKIRPNGTGRSASWIRLEEVENFEINENKGLNLFDKLLKEE